MTHYCVPTLLLYPTTILCSTLLYIFYYKLVPADSSLCNKRNPTGQSWFTGQSRRHLTHRIWFVIRKQFLNRLINTTFIWSVLSRQSDILTPYLISELDTLSLCDLISIDIWCLDIRDTLCYSDILTPLKILSCHPVVWYLFGTSYLVTWRDICVTPCDTVSCLPVTLYFVSDIWKSVLYFCH